MRKYLLYELKKNAFSICCIAVIVTLIYITPMLFDKYYTFNLWIISSIGGILGQRYTDTE